MSAGGRLRKTVRSLEKLVPASQRLRVELLRLKLRGRLEEELLNLESLAGRGAVAVDIGANRGLYTYRLSKLYREVIAFEPNERVLTSLKAAGLRNVTIHSVALSAAPAETKELYIPRVGDSEQDGWASFNPTNLSEATAVTALNVPVRTLDSYGLKEVGFIKIDVEGHELDVLRGASETLSTSRPTVLTEAKMDGRRELLGFFDSVGYSPFQYRDGRIQRATDEMIQSASQDNFILYHKAKAPRG